VSVSCLFQKCIKIDEAEQQQPHSTACGLLAILAMQPIGWSLPPKQMLEHFDDIKKLTPVDQKSSKSQDRRVNNLDMVAVHRSVWKESSPNEKTSLVSVSK